LRERRPDEPAGPSLSEPLPSLFRALDATETGLSEAGAIARLAAYGQNKIDDHPGPSLLRAFLARFRNPLVLVLVTAAAISAATGDTPSFLIIVAIVLLSIVLDVVQEYRAQNAAMHLREQVSLTATVLRDGRAREMPAARLVPGDVVLLAAGDLIPADCRLLTARDLYVNEALLTGEAYPTEKTLSDMPAAALLPRNAVFMGSSVLSGTAQALVVATGRFTELGGIAGALRKSPPETAFALGIRDFGRLILRLTVLLVLFALLINLLLHRPPLQSFLFALALAVGLTPELLPMIVSVTLAHGAMRLSHKRVIVKRLSAIHDLGSMDILCSDKTGTLTEADIKLTRSIDLNGSDCAGVLKAGLLNAAFETGLKSPLDNAILAAGTIDISAWKKLDEAPFDFERRRVSVLVEGEGVRRIIVKGAPEDILAICAQAERDGMASEPLDAAARQKARQVFEGLGREGYRVLGVAYQAVSESCTRATIGKGADFVLLGFLAFLDPPKAGARDTLSALAALGVAIKVVTGDSQDVTRHVCGALGLTVTGTLTGPEIETLSDEALSARLEQTTLFCRVTPPQKSRIIAALRRRGHVVGYLGDGINDAPSLHAADVGFSVDTGVDVAKDAASMILLEKDLGVIVEGVREGRRTYANILKYVMMGTSSNFGNMFSMAGGALLLPFLPMLPIQILLNNLLYDLSETAIPLDYVDEELLARPRRWDIRVVRKFMFLIGPISSIFDFVTFWLLLHLFGAGPALFHSGWFVESLATQILVIFIIRSAHPFLHRPHPALVATSLAAVGIALVLPYTRFGGWFGFVPLAPAILGALALTTAVYLCTVYLVRRWFFAQHGFG
jgi:Mg2+-importing ATPase